MLVVAAGLVATGVTVGTGVPFGSGASGAVGGTSGTSSSRIRAVVAHVSARARTIKETMLLREGLAM